MGKNLIFAVSVILVMLAGCTIPLNHAAGNAAPDADTSQTSQPPSSQASLNFSEWAAPDGSITLLVPQGWQATEWQVDTCTVSWNVLDPTGTNSAYMDNEIMVLKSEDARQMYEAYGMVGIENAPISGYLGAQEAVYQIIAPLTGASNVQITYEDANLSRQFSQALGTTGLAACDARVFEAAYYRGGILMRGRYFVQTYDFGEGTAWWINIWGYTSPAADWNVSSPVLEEIFTSAKPTASWMNRCRNNAGGIESTIDSVIQNRQEASDAAAEAWDSYILGE
jgi:hypothetical protein